AVGDAANGGLGVIYVQMDESYTPPEGTPAEAETHHVGANHTQVWLLLGAWLWPAGTAAVLVWGIVGQLKLRRLLVGAVRLEGNVWLADRIPTAFVAGLVRPKIFLPSALEGAGREYVLAHERTHIRRGDHVTRLLAFAALAIHWFNPLVWLAFALSGRDMETSCDEAVLRRSGGDIRADYCQTLLDMSAKGRFPSPCLLAFGEGDTGARIRNALHWKKPAFWVMVCAAAAIAAACVLLLTNPMGKKDGGAQDGNRVKVSFRAHYVEGTRVLDRGSFTAELALPEGWYVGDGYSLIPEGVDGEGYGHVFFRNADGELAAKMCYRAFDPDADRTLYLIEGGTEADYDRAAFCPELYGKNWRDFRSVRYSDEGETFRATILRQTDAESGSGQGMELETRYGIGRYDRGLGAYVAMELYEHLISDSEVEAIAESLELCAVSMSDRETAVSFSGKDYSGGVRSGAGRQFLASMHLPEGWSVRLETADIWGLPDTHGLLEPAYIYDERGHCAAFVAWAGFDPETVNDGTVDRGLSEAVNAALKERTDWVRYGWTENTPGSDGGTAYISTISADGETYSGRCGICVYSRELEAIVVVEFADKNEYGWAARLIAENIRLQAAPSAAGVGLWQFVVPGYYYDEGGMVREGPAFGVELALPEGWSEHSAYVETDTGVNTFELIPLSYMYDADGNYAGFIAWQELAWAVHPWHVNHYAWENETEIAPGVYTADVTYDEFDESVPRDYAWSSYETAAVRAESEELGVEVVAQFAPGTASREDAEALARSIGFYKARGYVAGFGGLPWGVSRADALQRLIYAGLEYQATNELTATWMYDKLYECTAWYGFGGENALVSGEYSFNGEGALTRQEQIELYEELLAGLEEVYGRAGTPVYLADLTPMDLQSVTGGRSDSAANSWTTQTPEGNDVDIYLELSGGDVTVSYSLLLE
ncbi:MAG: M56 family metallopeptidase, partial [Butyricicoccus sp.]|nr:M56 family metallopeptidase [Butyricicoccus sp.]